MAKYEKTRKYVVASIHKGIVTLTAPRGRQYNGAQFYVTELPKRMVKTLTLGKTVTLHRFSNQYTTYFAPKA